MTCDIDRWINGDWHSCVLDPVPSLIGEPTFGLLIGVCLYASLYFAAGGRSTTATVVTILMAASLFPILPAAYTGIAWTALLVGGAAAFLQAFQKYMLNPSSM